jgi:hypothetical protein
MQVTLGSSIISLMSVSFSLQEAGAAPLASARLVLPCGWGQSRDYRPPEKAAAESGGRQGIESLISWPPPATSWRIWVQSF